MDPEVSARLDRMDDKLGQLLGICATRVAVAELHNDIDGLKGDVRELQAAMYDIRDELRGEMHSTRDELRSEIRVIGESMASIGRQFDCLVEEMGKQYSRLAMRVAVVENDVKVTLKKSG